MRNTFFFLKQMYSGFKLIFSFMQHWLEIYITYIYILCCCCSRCNTTTLYILQKLKSIPVNIVFFRSCNTGLRIELHIYSSFSLFLMQHKNSQRSFIFSFLVSFNFFTFFLVVTKPHLATQCSIFQHNMSLAFIMSSIP